MGVLPLASSDQAAKCGRSESCPVQNRLCCGGRKGPNCVPDLSSAASGSPGYARWVTAMILVQQTNTRAQPASSSTSFDRQNAQRHIAEGLLKDHFVAKLGRVRGTSRLAHPGGSFLRLSRFPRPESWTSLTSSKSFFAVNP